jgi:hypothetical protein
MQFKKKNLKKEKSRYDGQFLVAAALTPPKTPPEVQLLQKQRLKKNGAHALSLLNHRS